MPIVPARLSTPPRVLPTWYERTLIFKHTSGRIRAEDAVQYGTIAVHATLPDEQNGLAPITITHVPSMLMVVRVDTIEDAMRFVETLWEKCAPAFSRAGEPADVARVPPDVVLWIKQCIVERKCV